MGWGGGGGDDNNDDEHFVFIKHKIEFISFYTMLSHHIQSGLLHIWNLFLSENPSCALFDWVFVCKKCCTTHMDWNIVCYNTSEISGPKIDGSRLWWWQYIKKNAVAFDRIKN